LQQECKQEVQLPQRDRASAFVIEPVKIFLTSHSITMQNLIVVSHVCASRAPGNIDVKNVPEKNKKR